MAETRVAIADGRFEIVHTDRTNIRVVRTNGTDVAINPQIGLFLLDFADDIAYWRALLRKYMQIVIGEGGKSWVRSTNWAGGRLTNEEHARLIAIAQALGATDAF